MIQDMYVQCEHDKLGTILNVFNQRHKAWQFTMHWTKITYFGLNVKSPIENIEIKTHVTQVLVTHSDKQLLTNCWTNTKFQK